MAKVKHSKQIVIASKRMIKSKLKTTSSDDLIILTNINGGRVIKRAYLVKILEELLSKIFLKWKNVPKKIIAKKGNVIDNTSYINIRS